MSLKLIVNKTDKPDAQPDSFVFQQERITIGRDRASDVPLVDPSRVVSKQHAELVVSGTTMQLTDLGSKNFTYLNGERLQAMHPYPVRPGDTLRIGAFEIDIALFETPPPSVHYDEADRTVFDIGFVNPFEDSAKLLAIALHSLSKQYDEEAPHVRDDALVDALSGAMDDDDGHAVYELIARLLAPEAVPSAAPPPSWVEEPTFTPPVVHPPPESAPSPPASSLTSDAARLHRLVDVVLETTAQLIGVPWQFRHEFIGQTIMQTDETSFLYEGEGKTLKRHLLDPALSDEKAAERLHFLEEALADVGRHQVAILDGYRAGVREGALNLIDQLNPDLLEQEAARAKALYRFIPLLAKTEALRRLHQQLRDLRAEDWSAAERRTYRPPFIKAYLARMTAMR